MNRRDLLTAALAAPLAAVPAVAVAETDTPVMALFREWNKALADERDLDAQYRKQPCDEIEALADAAADRRYQIELQMIEVKSEDARDVLAKIAAWTDYGVFQFDEGDKRLTHVWAEARALVGGEA